MTSVLRASVMRHVLIVAFHFPPEASSSGVLRTLKYTKYLVDSGWRSTVLTVRSSAYRVVDAELERQIHDTTRVVRTRYLNARRHLAVFGRYPALFAIPDVWSGWWPYGRAAGIDILRNDPPDMLYSTSPHATAHLIAGTLATRSALPWVMDLRDPWLEEPPEPETPRIVHWASRKLEARAVRTASAVVASTKHLRDALSARYPAQPVSKFHSIANGFDETDFTGLSPSVASRTKLTLVHSGSVNALFRDPRPLIHALRSAIDAGRLRAQEFELRLLGANDGGDLSWLQDCARECGLLEQVRILPRVSYRAALEEVSGAAVCLLLQASEDTASLVPAKLYEYLRAQKPILALVNAGATCEVVKDCQAGWTIDPRQSAAIAQAVNEIIWRWRDGSLQTKAACVERVKRYSRKHLAYELASLFDGLAAEPRHA